MPLEQKQKTKSLEDRTSDVMEAVAVLEYMPKYPSDPKQFHFICRLLATFIQTVDVNHANPEDPNDPLTLGWVNPLAWVVDQVGQTCFAFPPPIRWRMIYNERFHPLDGREPAAMQSIIED